MLAAGPGAKVTVYLNEDTSAPHGFLHEEILQYLRSHGVDGSTVFRAHAGFGAHGRVHTEHAGDVAGLHIPILIVFVETPEKVEAILPGLLELVTDGLVESQPTRILKHVTGQERVIS